MLLLLRVSLGLLVVAGGARTKGAARALGSASASISGGAPEDASRRPTSTLAKAPWKWSRRDMRRWLAARGEHGDDDENNKLTSVPQAVLNLVKNIVGSGMLALPSGVAAFSGSGKALLPSFATSLLCSIASAYGFVLIADACRITGKSAYQDAWGDLVSKRTRWMPSLACFGSAYIACVAFSMILGDCISLCLSPFGLPAALSSRTSIIIALSIFIFFPLCRMQSLKPLAKFSALGVMSNVYICVFMLIRYLDGSYADQGAFVAAAPQPPSFAPATGSAWGTAATPRFALLLSMLSLGYLAHYNTPTFYQQLAPDSKGDRSKRFFAVAMFGFTISSALMSFVMALGFLTFGMSSNGLILNSYATTDKLAALARWAIAVSLTCSYPIVFQSVRDQYVSFLGDKGRELMASRPDVITASLISTVMVLAVCFSDVGKLAAFGGAVFAVFIVYVAPPIMALCARFKATRDLSPSESRLQNCVSIVQVLMVIMGTILAFVGVDQTLRS